MNDEKSLQWWWLVVLFLGATGVLPTLYYSWWTSPPAPPQLIREGETRVYVVPLNRASAIELEALPYIGPERAQAIVKFRQDHGFFRHLKEIEKVRGIGPGVRQKITPYVTLDEGKKYARQSHHSGR